MQRTGQSNQPSAEPALTMRQLPATSHEHPQWATKPGPWQASCQHSVTVPRRSERLGVWVAHQHLSPAATTASMDRPVSSKPHGHPAAMA